MGRWPRDWHPRLMGHPAGPHSGSPAQRQRDSPTIRESLLWLEAEGKEAPPGCWLVAVRPPGTGALSSTGGTGQGQTRGYWREEGWGTLVTACAGCRTELGRAPPQPPPEVGSPCASPVRRVKAVPGPQKRTAGDLQCEGGRCGVWGDRAQSLTWPVLSLPRQLCLWALGGRRGVSGPPLGVPQPGVIRVQPLQQDS